MTDNNHPITPPPELLHQWATEYWGNPGESIGEGEKYIAIQAARWGSDQELEACCGLLDEWGLDGDDLMECRRPKPPSLAEEALKELTDWTDKKHGPGGETFLCEGLSVIKIRAALERLQELENNA